MFLLWYCINTQTGQACYMCELLTHIIVHTTMAITSLQSAGKSSGQESSADHSQRVPHQASAVAASRPAGGCQGSYLYLLLSLLLFVCYVCHEKAAVH